MHYFIDLVDACNLACPACPRGLRQMRNSRAKMAPELFRTIIDKIVRQPFGPKIVCLFNWTEPFLHEGIAGCVAYCRENKLLCSVSSNLSLPNLGQLLPDTLQAGLTKLMVSVSGFTQETYNRYHRGGDVERVKHNLGLLSRAIAKGSRCTAEVHYLLFPYNRDEVDLFRHYCGDIGLNFLVKAGRGLHDDMTWDPKLMQFMPRADGNAEERRNSSNNLGPCSQVFDMMSLDCRGDAYLCCCRPYLEPMRIGNFLEMDDDEQFLRRFMHPECGPCEYPRRAWTANDLDKLEKARRSYAGAGLPG